MSEIPVQITLKLRNAKMVEARKRYGYSQKHLAEIANVSYNLIQRLEKFELPESMFEYWSDDHFTVIAETLDLEVDDIAPPELVGRKITHTVRAIERVEAEKLLTMAGPQRRYILPSPEDVAVRNEKQELIERLLDTLTWREREVLKMRFGLAGCDSYPLAEVANHYHTTKNRIRQLETRALEKLENRLASSEEAADRKNKFAAIADRQEREWEEKQ